MDDQDFLQTIQLNNIQQEKITKILRPTNFDFRTPKFIDIKEMLNETNKFKFKESLTSRPLPLREAYTWKPKLPSKKLFEQPKFLMSLEKKKIRVINGFRQISISPPITLRQKGQFKSEKLKPNRQLIKHPDFQESYTSQQITKRINQSRTTRRMKAPHMHFNMHHFISKKKHVSTQKSLKQGSNNPYFTFFLSDKANKKTLQQIKFKSNSSHTNRSNAAQFKFTTAKESQPK